MSLAFSVSSAVNFGTRCGFRDASWRCSRPGSVRMLGASGESAPDIAIVGGGAAGLGTALSLALSGASVKVLTRAPDESALRASAGMIAPNCEATDSGAFRRLCMASRDMYSEFVESVERISGEQVRYVSRGDFLFPLRAGEVAPNDIVGAGRYLDSGMLRNTAPSLGRNVIGAYQVPGDAHVDSRALFTALQRACGKLGVKVELGADVTSVVAAADNSTVEYLVLSSGERVVAGHYVVAAGAWSHRVLPNLPVVPVKGQMLCLEPRLPLGAPLSADARKAGSLKHVLYRDDVYIVPKHDGKQFYVGATVEEGAGFDRETTAGGALHLLNKAIELVPQFADFHVAEMWAGLRPATPDRKPVFGLSEYSNLSVCSGFFRNGVLLAPAAAAIASAVARGEESSLPHDLATALDAFSPLRFSGKLPEDASSKTRSSGASSGTEKAKASDEVILYQILPDGSRKPIYPRESPDMFMKGAGDTKSEPASSTVESPPKFVSETPKGGNGLAANEASHPSQRRRQPAPNNKALHTTDGYESILDKRGKSERETTSAALAANRSFGVTPRPGHEGEESSLSPGEWAALDAAHEQGLADAMSLRYESDGSESSELNGLQVAKLDTGRS